MKHYYSVIFFLALVSGCAQEQEEVIETNEMPTKPEQIEIISDSATDFYDNERIIEFMLCDEGSEYTDESMRALISEWNTAVGAMENKVMASYGLRPQYETEMFDGIWALVWPDMQTRNAGWEAWPEGGGKALREQYDSVLTCNSETSYMYSGQTIAAPTSVWESEPPHFVSYHFCSYNDGFMGTDLQPTETKIAQWIAQYRQTNADDGMALNGLTPLFDSRNPDDEIDDFDGVGMWAYRSVEDANKFAESWAESAKDIQAEVDKFVSCEEYNFDMYIFRLPEA